MRIVPELGLPYVHRFFCPRWLLKVEKRGIMHIPRNLCIDEMFVNNVQDESHIFSGLQLFLNGTSYKCVINIQKKKSVHFDVFESL